MNTMALSLTTTLALGLLAACGDTAQTASASAASANTTAANAPTPTLSETKELKIYNWSDYVDPATVSAFEKKYGVKVTYNYYDSDEALESKMLTGRSGYDLAGPSNAFVGRQIQAGAYLKLDKTLIPNWKNINPKLLEMLQGVDPGNQYAVPNYWGMNTFAINTDKVKAALGNTPMPDNAWDLVFNPAYTSKLKSCGISYLDSPAEMFPLALHYVGKDPNSQQKADVDAAAAVLQSNSANVLRYSSSGYIDDLARGDICVAVGFGGDLNIAKRRRAEATGKKDTDVMVPKEGVGLWVDSLTIPKDAANVLNAHRYLNWILDPKIAAQNGNYVTYAPSSMPAKPLMDKQYSENSSIFPSDAVLANSYIMLPTKPDILKYEVRLWQNIKAAK